MRMTFLLALALLTAPAVPASASGLGLAWDHCFQSGGTWQKLFACDQNLGQDVLVVSVIPPADMPSFAATSVIVDVVVDAGSLPPWWLTATGQCRANAIVPSFDPTSFPLTAECPSLWGDTVPLQVFAIQQGLHGPGTFRINSGAAVPAGSEYLVQGNAVSYLAARITFMHSKTVGAGACDGCRTGACLLLNEMKMQQPAGLGDYTVTNAAEIGSNSATMNADGSYYTYCYTPTANRTWGAVKSLYR